MFCPISEDYAAIRTAFDFGIGHCHILDDFMLIVNLLVDGSLVEANLRIICGIAVDSLIAGL